jgi:hypothetical protein
MRYLLATLICFLSIDWGYIFFTDSLLSQNCVDTTIGYFKLFFRIDRTPLE